MDSDSWKVCRLCLSESHLRPIFDEGHNLELKLTTCALIQKCEEDGLPNFVCESCEYKTCSFYEFKKQCEATDVKLRETLKYRSSIRIETNYNNDISNEDYTDVEENVSPKIVTEQISKTKIKIKKIKKKSKFKRVKDDGVCIRVKNFAENNEENSSKNVTNKLWHTPENVTVCEQTTCKQFQCELCGDVFRWMSVLNKHLMTHSTDKARFACPACPKRFTRKEYVGIHMRTHAGVRPFICEICAHSFVRRQDLIRHKMIHDDEKKYACPECNKKFKRSADVHCHMRTHTGVVPFNCRRCSKGYKSRTGMMKHYMKNQCGTSDLKQKCDTKIINDL